MRFDIKEEKKNPFLKRKEITIEIENPEEATPSKATVQKMVAEKTGMEMDSVEVIDITQGKGVSKARARINVWDEKKIKAGATDVSEANKKEEEPS